MGKFVTLSCAALALWAGTGLAQQQGKIAGGPKPLPEQQQGKIAGGPKPLPLPKWEYRVLTREEIQELGKNNLTAGLNELGKDGWELVSVFPGFTPPKTGPDQFYFKRPAAKLLSPPLPAGKEKAAISVLMLKKRDAVVLAQLLDKLFNDSDHGKVRLVADPASNSLIVDAGPLETEMIEALVIRLDDAAQDNIKKSAPEKVPQPK
jgi:hypothetical protein